MDIEVVGLRDRRVAASDEYLDGDEREERARFEAHTGRWDPARPHSGRFIFGGGTRPRLASERRPTGFDLADHAFAREPEAITTVVLHSTTGVVFEESDLPDVDEDAVRTSYHRVDGIIAHFVVLGDGTIVYTHDVQYVLNDAGGRRGVDIEFAGDFPNARRVRAGARRVTPSAIRAGRTLVAVLAKRYLSNLRFVHPHGQVQRGRRGGPGNGGKYDSCPGPDVWVNVGEWAVAELGLTAEETDAGYPNHGISRRQSNEAYRQDL